MKNLYEAISQKINIEVNDGDYLVNVTERLLPLVANILSHKVGKRVEISVYDQKSNVSVVNQIIKVGEKFTIETLSEYGYTRVPRVWNDKEFSVLGDLVIFQRVGEEFAVRISMFDNVVEEISLVNKDDRSLISKIQSYFLTEDDNVLARYCSDYQYGEILNLNFLRNEKVSEGVDIGIREFPGGRFSQIEKIIKSYISLDFNVFLSTNNDEFEIEGCKRVEGEFPLGFVISKSKIALVTDFELSGRIELFKASTRIKNENLFNEIVRGDYIVHQDHGIGIYQDLIVQDEITYFDIRYAGKDRLLVPVSACDKLSKYVSSGGSTPKLTGLNSVVWGKIKAKALEDIQAMAKELVGIYAMRKISKSSVMVRDHHDEIELGKFVEAFAYADTEDQMVITQEILKDLSKDSPMDRLIVGDVGFGKTELAARAIFLCVNAGYQVAMLAPTTILSMQHYHVLTQRFSEYPFRIEVLNRYAGNEKRNQVLNDLEAGKVDILIGTHSILSDAVKFKKLGLLVIDEEQKFGVVQKEKLKKKKLDVHTLSMTATPIPRTLNMAISGIRDLSILSSVPMGRKPIENHFGEFDWDVALKAIDVEVRRGGQVYYMHNRVAQLSNIKEEILARRPEIKVEISHGQMGMKKISDVMERFSKGEIDVLVCSSIVENGLDIPNVNTIIVDDSQRYGLSSLYQIRGRVGRSPRQAYAYFFHTLLKGDALLRMDALSEANNIGSGFILSNRDLEIRGAGNILGKSQSGAINSVGYAMYSQMLEETVSKLQDGKYK